MRLLVCVVFSLSVLATTSASAATKFGLGIILGAPTALTGKYWLDQTQAIDFGVNYSFSSSVSVYSDYLRHFPDFFRGKAGFLPSLTPYVGVGALFHSSKNPPRAKAVTAIDETVTNLNLRIPLGLEWMAPKVPLGVFVEIAPGVFLIPDIAASIQGGLGVRFYF